jgi:hypothetical protein
MYREPYDERQMIRVVYLTHSVTKEAFDPVFCEYVYVCNKRTRIWAVQV